MSNSVKVSPIHKPDEKERLLLALQIFIAQRSGITARDYFETWADSAGVDAFKQDKNQIAQHGRDARAMWAQIERRNIGAPDLADALRRAYSGRLSWDGEKLDYCTGQYFCTEYRAAACAGMALALRLYWRADGNDVQTMARNWLGRGIASRWFD